MATGMVYAPTTIGWSLAAVASPRIVRRLGHRAVLTASVAVVALGYLALATVQEIGLILVVFALQGVAMGLSITPVTDLIMGALPAARAGVASALNDVSRQVGGAVGVAVLGSLLSFVFVRRVPTLDNLAQAPGSNLARAGFMSGYRWVMLASAAVVLVGVVAAWLGTSGDAGTT